MQKIKLVVACQYGDTENILGYILPELPNSLQILHASALRGAVVDRLAGSISLPKKWRLATEQDFERFAVSFVGFKNDHYEYADAKTVFFDVFSAKNDAGKQDFAIGWPANNIGRNLDEKGMRWQHFFAIIEAHVKRWEKMGYKVDFYHK